MKTEVTSAIDELKQQFSNSTIRAREDGQGGAYVLIEEVDLGAKYEPGKTWIGFHISAQYPYADIYPVFISAEVVRVDGVAFKAPITGGHQFDGKPAFQISRRNNSAQQDGFQTATGKILKILHFLEEYK